MKVRGIVPGSVVSIRGNKQQGDGKVLVIKRRSVALVVFSDETVQEFPLSSLMIKSIAIGSRMYSLEGDEIEV